MTSISWSCVFWKGSLRETFSNCCEYDKDYSYSAAVLNSDGIVSLNFALYHLSKVHCICFALVDKKYFAPADSLSFHLLSWPYRIVLLVVPSSLGCRNIPREFFFPYKAHRAILSSSSSTWHLKHNRRVWICIRWNQSGGLRTQDIWIISRQFVPHLSTAPIGILLLFHRVHARRSLNVKRLPLLLLQWPKRIFFRLFISYCLCVFQNLHQCKVDIFTCYSALPIRFAILIHHVYLGCRTAQRTNFWKSSCHRRLCLFSEHSGRKHLGFIYRSYGQGFEIGGD